MCLCLKICHLNIDEKYMRRALCLARNGEGRVSPNPMVGAVIVHNDRIIGEGFHAFYGGPHAEVNAVNSVKEEDLPLLKESTMYVTLEPCAHFGKTPPCANLVAEKGIPRIVIGSLDPNEKVAGKGIKILESVGIKVKIGVLEEDCKELNRRFIKSHTSEYPWIELKWAQSSDGFMAGIEESGQLVPVKFSSPLSTVWMHRERAQVDAILVGSNTARIDHPQLDVRYWGGDSPEKYVAEGDLNLKEFLKKLKKDGISSIMVEGGSKLLQSFIDQDLYDEIRREISPGTLGKGLKAPVLPINVKLKRRERCRENIIERWNRI